MNPAAVGVATGAIPSISPGKEAVCVGKPGDASGAFPKAGDCRGLTKVLVGDIGSFKFNGVGPLGNSH